jgi:hypothetical protein
MSMDNVKYPKTLHLPWSEGLQNDDRCIESLDNFIDKEVVVSEKIDGENTGMTCKSCHARSLDSKHHPSRNIVKQLHASIASQIPEGWKLFGENVYAKHSIFYNKLTAYFYLFSIWTENNECLSWEDTIEWAGILGLETVPVLYRGIWDEDKIKTCWTGKSVFGEEQEGYVVRLTSSFKLDDFSISLSKMVRKGHVQTSKHWMNEEIVPNCLG